MIKIILTQTKLALKGRLGIVIDGTGGNYSKIQKQNKLLKRLGYDTFIIFVNTTIETALERNKTRDRKVPEKIVKSSWQLVQANKAKYQKLFKRANFYLVDNTNPTEDLFDKITKEVRKVVGRPVMNKYAKNWILSK